MMHTQELFRSNGTHSTWRPRLPEAIQRVALRQGILPSRSILVVSVATQMMSLFEKVNGLATQARFPRYAYCRRFVVSTSRFGIGQIEGSNQTPLGLHRIARKAGGGHPIGTIFKGRRPIGFTWQGQPDGAIVHRILWL